MAGVKRDEDKAQMNLVDGRFLTAVTDALAYGNRKYEPNNWRKGLNASRLYSATLRHLTAWNDGESFDSESDLNHLSHAAASLMMLIGTLADRPELDDRYYVDSPGFARKRLSLPDQGLHGLPEEMGVREVGEDTAGEEGSSGAWDVTSLGNGKFSAEWRDSESPVDTDGDAEPTDPGVEKYDLSYDDLEGIFSQPHDPPRGASRKLRSKSKPRGRAGKGKNRSPVGRRGKRTRSRP